MDNERDASLWERCSDSTPRDRRNSIRLLVTGLIWLVSLAGSIHLIKNDLLPAGPLPWLVATLPAVTGLLMMLAYGRFLRQADELQRMIQLQALALGFGVGVFGLVAYSVFERLGFPPADNGHLIMVMSVFYMLGIVLGWRRYR